MPLKIAERKKVYEGPPPDALILYVNWITCEIGVFPVVVDEGEDVIEHAARQAARFLQNTHRERMTTAPDEGDSMVAIITRDGRVELGRPAPIGVEVPTEKGGELHISLADLLRENGYGDTPENRQMLLDAAAELAKQKGIPVRVVD